jgi:hypothetical protein
MGIAEERKRRMRDKAALTAFGALLAEYGKGKPVTEIAEEAWRASDEFMRARAQSDWDRYRLILRRFKGAAALRRIMEMDGITGRCLEYFFEVFKSKRDPLLAYAEEMFPLSPTLGQMAILNSVSAATQIDCKRIPSPRMIN